MRALNVTVLCVLLTTIGCTREVAVQTPLERLLETSRAELCSGALADALRDVRRPSYEWATGELQSTLRWAIAHNRDDCGGSTSGPELWLVTIEAWERVGGDAAGRALVGSLRFSFRPDTDPERGNDTFTQETEAALHALRQTAPHGTTVIQELLEWYERNAENCAVETYREEVLAIITASGQAGALAATNSFPPPQGAGRCAPGWLLSDVVSAVHPSHSEHILAQVVDDEIFNEDLQWLLSVVDGTTGRLQDALAAEACALSATLAERAFSDADGDPRDAVADTYGACAAPEGGAERIQDLQQRLVRWLVDNRHEDEAWTTLESLPSEDVDAVLYYDIGLAAITARLERATPLAALELFEAVGARDGLDASALHPVREPLHQALIDATRQSLESRNVAEARLTLDPAERIFGETEASRRLGVLTTLIDAIDAAESGTCRDEDVVAHLREALRDAREKVLEFYRDDSDLRDLLTAATRG